MGGLILRNSVSALGLGYSMGATITPTASVAFAPTATAFTATTVAALAAAFTTAAAEAAAAKAAATMIAAATTPVGLGLRAKNGQTH